jgi:hypothetical protein
LQTSPCIAAHMLAFNSRPARPRTSRIRTCE